MQTKLFYVQSLWDTKPIAQNSGIFYFSSSFFFTLMKETFQTGFKHNEKRTDYKMIQSNIVCDMMKKKGRKDIFVDKSRG